MAEFFAELKRRHIYRVGATYVVVAWVVVQVIDVLSQIFELPGSIARPAVILLAIGFPVALIAAWMIESKPHQAVASAVKSKPAIVDWTLCGALAVVLLFMAYQKIAGSSDSMAPQAGVEAARSASLNPRTGVSLAVLPFANLSDDESQTFFSDGITEEIITALARIPDLRVVARESAAQFKSEGKDLRAVGQSLGATHLIEGSVRKAGLRVRITARLVRADDGVNTWVNSYDRELTDVFAIQEEIATSIAGALRMPLGLRPGEQLVANRGIDAESYEQFLRGKAALLRARTAYTEQLAIFEPLVAKNPNYAPAWAGLARAYRSAAGTASRTASIEEYRRSQGAFQEKSVAAAQRAVALDPSLVDGQLALALTQSGPRRWLLTEDLLLKVLALDPNHAEALDAYSSLLYAVARTKEALEIKQRVYQLEPFVPLYNGNLAQALWLDGQNDAAIALLKDNLNGEGAGAHLELGRIYASLGRFQEAADITQQMLSKPIYQRFNDLILDGVRLLRSAPTRVEMPENLPRLFDGGFIYLYVGAPERVLEYYEEGGVNPSQIARFWHPTYSVVRKTERFKKLIRELGLVNYWRERGWPGFCRPIGADDFECS